MRLRTAFLFSRAFKTLAFGGACLALSGCMSAYVKSVGGDTDRSYEKIYLSSFDNSWAAVLEALKSYYLDVTNRDAGIIQTRWMDNTSDRVFVDEYGSAKANLKAQFRFKVLVSQGFFDGKRSVRVTVRKEQLVQTDVLDGWRPVESDSIDENTLLYRIGRLIQMRAKLEEIETKRRDRELKNVEF